MFIRIILLSIFLVLFADPALIAQPNNETFTTNPITVRQSIKKDGGQTSYDWYSYVDKSIGRKDDDTYYHRFRVRMPFVFGSIPHDARIDSVIMRIAFSGFDSGSSRAKVVKLPNTYGSAEVTWNQFGGSQTTYFDNLRYDKSPFIDHKSSTLTNDVKTAVASQNGEFTIGVMSVNEGTNNTHAWVSVTIRVYWSPLITVTVRNSFTGGNIEVDGAVKGSPWTSGTSGQPKWYSGDSHNVRAYTQTINGITYPFLGTWTIVETGQQLSQPSENTPVSIAPTVNRTYRANFGQPVVEVTVEQMLSTGASVGTIGLWEGGPDFVPYTVPKDFAFPLSSTQTLLGTQDIISGQKYNIWTAGGVPEPDVLNHRVFSIQSGFPDRLTSELKSTTQGSTIRIDFVDVPGSYSGTVQFKDPWLIDYPDPAYNNRKRNRGMAAPFKNRTSPFSPDFTTSYGGDVYKGVFLNENPTWDDTKSNYSVGAPAQQAFNISGQNFIANFSNWTGTNVSYQNANAQQTGVVFQQSNATATAHYKGHRVSNTSKATASPGQRKLVTTYGGYHMVYESAGDVWYSHSQDGVSWSNETMLSRGNGTARNPAIAEYIDLPGNNHVYVVWVDETVRTGAGGYDVHVRKRNINSGVWSAVEAVIGPEHAANDGYAHANAKPSAVVYREAPSYSGGHFPQVIIVYEASGGGIICSYKGWQYYYDDHVWRTIPVGNTGTTHRNPSITLNPWWYVVVSYDNNNNLYIVRSEEIMENHAVAQLDFLAPEVIGSSSTYRKYRQSVVTSDPMGRTYAAWVADRYWMGMNMGEVVLQQTLENGIWGPMHMFSSDINSPPVMMPAISGYEIDNGGILAFSDGIVLFRYTSSDGYNWSSLPLDYFSASGLFHPSVNNKTFSTQNDVLILYSQYSAPLYRLKFTETGSLQKLAETQSTEEERISLEYTMEEFRNVEMIDTSDGGQISFRCGNIHFTSRESSSKHVLEFVPNENKEWKDFLNSKPFRADKNNIIGFNVNIYGLHWPHPMNILVELRDSQTGDLISVLERFDIRHDDVVAIDKDFNFSLHPSGYSREVYLSIRFDNLDTEHVKVRPVHEKVVKGRESLFKVAELLNETNKQIPPEYRLLQNYPNPFNPVTKIEYHLRESSRVLLTVYDYLGREVTRLVDDYREAGYHSALWDAGSIASGLYIYRLIIFGEDRVLHTDRKTMMLIK